MSPRAARTEGDAPKDEPQEGPPDASEDGKRSWSPRNWRVRTRLLALVAIPTAAALALGGLRLGANVGDTLTHSRIQEMATLGQDIVTLTYELGSERKSAAAYIADDKEPQRRSDTLHKDYQDQIQATKRAQSSVEDSIASLGDVGGGLAEERRERMTGALDGLDAVRDEIQSSPLTVLPAATKYRQVINALNDFNQTIGQGTDDARLQESVRAMTALNRAREHLSFESALILHGLSRGAMSTGVEEAVLNTRSRYENETQNFVASATPDQRQMHESTFTGLEVSQMATVRQRVLLRMESGSRLNDREGINSAAGYSEAADEALSRAHESDVKMAGLVTEEAGDLSQAALLRSLLDSALVLAILGLTGSMTLMVVRSLLSPLRQLREGALRVAGRDLPESIERMKDTTTTPDQVEVLPIDVGTRDEINQVALSFDEVHRVAMRLAAEEAALRANVNAMFVNLSRRSQTLVERQLRLIDGLEQSEQDSDRLGDLFQLDHLATRMRRNAENLLVLSGQDNTRKWAQPVPLVDVLRGAVSEVEQYDRVNVRAPSDVSVLGRPVNDVIHLVAELVENATSFSSHDSQVSVTARIADSGGAVVEVTDSGIGMPPEEIEAVNGRLAEPPMIDVAVSRRMGLFVVSRLAARHGIRVRLAEARNGGITAVAEFPADLLITPVEPDRGGAVPDTFAQAEEAFAQSPAPIEPDDGWGRGAYSGPSADKLPKRRPGNNRTTSTGSFPALPADEHPPSGEDLWGKDAEPTDQSRSAGSLFDPRQTGPMPVAEPPAPPEFPERPAYGEAPGHGADAYPEYRSGHGAGWANGTANGTANGAANGTANGAANGSADSAPYAPDADRPAPGAPSERDTGQWWQEPRDGYGSTAYLSRRYGRGPAAGQETVVPPSPESGSEALPIFDAIESNWFKRRTGGPETGPIAASPAPSARSGPAPAPQPPRTQAGPAAHRPAAPAQPPAAPAPQAQPGSEDGWHSDADRGWQAAQSAAEPIAGGLTESGLPKRVPKANLVPGTAPRPDATNPGTIRSRSADQVRNRFTGFQKGVRDGRSQNTGEYRRGAPGERGDGDR